jgi:hypothetical protein
MNLNLRLCDLHRVFPMGMAAGINLRGDLHGSGRHHFLIHFSFSLGVYVKGNT